MFGRKNHQEQDERFDRIGRALVRAAAMSDQEVEAVASSPFLYARLRARIAAAEQERRGDRWLMMLVVARRAVPAMVLAAIATASVFWFMGRGSNVINPLTHVAFLDATETNVERVVFAESGALSSDEVLATIVNGNELGGQR